MIMARSFGSPFSEILQLANSAPRGQMIAALSPYKPRGEIKRFLELTPAARVADPERARRVSER